MKVMILAGGKGSRLYPLTAQIPKPLIPVVNEPIIQHLINSVNDLTADGIYVNLFHQSQRLIDFFINEVKTETPIHWKIEEQLAGPAGSIRTFYEELKQEPLILVISGDALHDVDLATFIEFHQSQRAELSVVMKEVNNPHDYGVGEVNEDGRIVNFTEKPSDPYLKTGLASCGIYCFAGSLIDRIPANQIYDFGKDLIPLMVSHGEAVYGYRTSRYWLDIGKYADLLIGNLDALQGHVQLNAITLSTAHNWQKKAQVFMQTAILPNDIDITGHVLIGENVQIGNQVTLKGPLVIGDSVVIGDHSYLTSSLILPNSYLPSNTILTYGIYKTQS